MLSAATFFRALEKAGVEYFAGVPDSLLKSFCAYLTDNVSPENQTIAANEGAAIGLGLGYHLATQKVPLVYMQNSGLGNTVNPLTSLTDPEVYAVPMLMLIGWRGEPNVADEPQHKKQGRITLSMLNALEIPYRVIDADEADIDGVISGAVALAESQGCAVAIVVKKGTFAPLQKQTSEELDHGWNREDAIKNIVDSLGEDDIVVSTTGMASRELFEYREILGQSHEKDFLTVGGMGHASQIAMGISSQTPGRTVVCIDGDGALLMHMGALAICATSKLEGFKHIVINNSAHDSVGGQPTVAADMSLADIAKACGYKHVQQGARVDDDIESKLAELMSVTGPAFLELRVNKGNRSDLGRPTTTPIQNKEAFMAFVGDSSE